METLIQTQVKKLLSSGESNAKTVKNDLKTFIMYLAPYKQNSYGKNLCSKATKGCSAACLTTTFRMAWQSNVLARIRKADFLISDQKGFCEMLVKELSDINRKAIKGSYKVAIRLNGTTDLDFFAIVKNKLGINLFDFSNLVFYDYTKLIGKVLKYQDQMNSGRYFLTFSRSETNWNDCLTALNMGVNVAVVFGSDELKPTTFEGFPVIDGDKTDIEMMKFKGVILALKAKGKAKKDTTGFVIR